MKQTINKTQFIDAFKTWGTYANNFSYEALDLMFDYFELLEDETGEEIELDVVAICCEYQEATLQEVANNYNIDISGACGLEVDIVTDYLRENTQLIAVTDIDTFVFAQF